MICCTKVCHDLNCPRLLSCFNFVQRIVIFWLYQYDAISCIVYSCLCIVIFLNKEDMGFFTYVFVVAFTWNYGLKYLIRFIPRNSCASNLHFQLALQWRQNERGGVSNHQSHDSLLNRLFGRRSNKILKLRVTGFWDGKSPVTGEFPAQRASNAEKASIWRRRHEVSSPCGVCGRGSTTSAITT